jgi:hypothetical protein
MPDKQIVEANLRKMTGTDKLDLPAYMRRLCTDDSAYSKVNAKFYCKKETGEIKYFSEFPIEPEDYTRPQLRLELILSFEGRSSVNRVVYPRDPKEAPKEMKENLEATVKVYNERFGLTEVGIE